MKKTISIMLVLMAISAAAEKRPLDRYQSIIDRQMFGAPPPGFDATKMANEVSKSQTKELTQEQEQIKSSIHFSIINVTPSGKTAVGFTDNSDAKTPVHYYLKVGESSGGWTLKEADALKAWMKIEKNGVEVELTLGQNSAKGGGTTQKTASSGQTAAKSAPAEDRLKRPAPGNRSTLLSRRAGGGLRDINQLRAERDARQKEAEAKAAEDRARQEADREEMKKSLAELQASIAENRKTREALERAQKENEEAKAELERTRQFQNDNAQEDNGNNEESQNEDNDAE